MLTATCLKVLKKKCTFGINSAKMLVIYIVDILM